MVVLGQSGYFQAKEVVFVQSGCIRAKIGCSLASVVVFGQGSYVRASWLYSGKCACIGAKVDIFGQKFCIRAKELLFGKLVVFGQNWL